MPFKNPGEVSEAKRTALVAKQKAHFDTHQDQMYTDAKIHTLLHVERFFPAWGIPVADTMEFAPQDYRELAKQIYVRYLGFVREGRFKQVQTGQERDNKQEENLLYGFRMYLLLGASPDALSAEIDKAQTYLQKVGYPDALLNPKNLTNLTEEGYSRESFASGFANDVDAKHPVLQNKVKLWHPATVIHTFLLQIAKQNQPLSKEDLVEIIGHLRAILQAQKDYRTDSPVKRLLILKRMERDYDFLSPGNPA